MSCVPGSRWVLCLDKRGQNSEQAMSNGLPSPSCRARDVAQLYPFGSISPVTLRSVVTKLTCCFGIQLLPEAKNVAGVICQYMLTFYRLLSKHFMVTFVRQWHWQAIHSKLCSMANRKVTVYQLDVLQPTTGLIKSLHSKNTSRQQE